MARFDQNKVASVKAVSKQKRMKKKTESKRKKSEETSMIIDDDVFDLVASGKSTFVKEKLKDLKKIRNQNLDKKSTPSAQRPALSEQNKIHDTVTPLCITFSKNQTPHVAKKIRNSAKKMKINFSDKNGNSVRKLAKQDSAKKDDRKKMKIKMNAFVNSPKTDNKKSPKQAGDKRWRDVDEEVSFCSDSDVSPAPSSAKKSKSGDKLVVKVKSRKTETNIGTKGNTKAIRNIDKVSKSSPLKSKNVSGIIGANSSQSAFKVVSKKNNAFKLSVNQLVPVGSASKKLDQIDLDTKSKKRSGKDKAKKKTLSVATPKRQNSEKVASIETDNSSDSDCEILYSLSDTSDLAINSEDSSPSPNKTNTAAGRSKSEGSLETNVSKKEKGVKKSKSTSENVNRGKKTKKIKLIDSLKQISPSSVNNMVRPVSPTPVYTTVKHTSTDGSHPADTQPLLAQAQWVIDDDNTPSTAQSASLPMSPASMSYKDLLENLPSQLHPKNNKKKASASDDSSDIERRISVRASECAFKYKNIVIKKCQKYTQIWLNTHTKMKNALNPSVMQEISAALNASKYDDSTLVMFSGLGNVFCSGIDLHYLTVGDRKVASRKMADALRDLVRKFITFPKLLIAVVTGPAIGMGSALLPLCDIVYASDKATFYMPYAQLSQTPEGCASFTLPHIVGTAMANELLIGGRKLTAIEACQLGLVSQVYWPTSMMQEVIPRVQHMALLSGKVLETTKLLIRSHQRTKLDLTNESECNLLTERWSANECQRAIEEFLSNEKNYML